MDVSCGIDWAEDHHDVALVDAGGQVLARLRITDDAAGLTALLELLAAHGDSQQDPVPAAIETPRGLLVSCLRATGRPVYPVNPMSVARYRDRLSVAYFSYPRLDACVEVAPTCQSPSRPAEYAPVTVVDWVTERMGRHDDDK